MSILLYLIIDSFSHGACFRKWHSSTSAVEFDFFTEVCEMIGLNSQSQSHAVDCLLLLHELLDCLEFHNIYQVCDCVV